MSEQNTAEVGEAERLEVNEDLENCDELLEYLKRSRGFDFSGYKRASLVRRIAKRMQMVEVANSIDYIDYLEVHPEEFAQLFNTILINVTAFFRDPPAWETLDTIVLPRILAAHGGSAQIRIWSAGCASGEEPYSVMMLLAERIGVDGVRDRVKVYATDIDEEALQEARQAVYSERRVASVPEHLLAKYFRLSGGGYIFNTELRRNVIYGRHDLINDAPISRVDLLLCRNTLMYFNAEVQARVLSRFHFALNPKGPIMLGKAELLLAHSNLFTPLDLKRHIFSKVPKENMRDRLLTMVQGDSSKDGAELSAASIVNIRQWQSVFDVTPSAQVVVDRNGHMVLINNLAREQFRLSDKDIGRPLQDLELSYRPVELRSMIDQVYRDHRPAALKDVPYTNTNNRKAELGYLDLQVSPVMDSENSPIGAVIAFTDVTRYKQLQDELQAANRELETAYEELQSTNEELETTNEELQSTIEELETTNEELQSSNEELETMNEELQSTNEELQAINDELRQRSFDLNKLNNYMNGILSSLHAGATVLDKDMYVQVWNGQSEDLWGLRSGEAVGHHFLTLDIGLPLEELKVPLRAAIGGETQYSEIVIAATNRRGKPMQCKVSLSTLAGELEGEKGVLILMEAME